MPIWEYSDESLPIVLDQIRHFDADFGGTDILEPLVKAISLNAHGKIKRVFLLTDGEVDNKHLIFDYVR